MGKTRRYDNGGVKRPKGNKKKKRKTFREFQEEEPFDIAYKKLDHTEDEFYNEMEDADDADRYYK